MAVSVNARDVLDYHSDKTLGWQVTAAALKAPSASDFVIFDIMGTFR